MTETWNPGIPALINEIALDVPDINENLTYLANRMGYEGFVDSTEPDQGSAGSGRSLKDLIDAIGGTKIATIRFPHLAQDGDTTTYTLTTDETVPANISLVIEPGAIIDGAGTLTIDGPENIVARKNQQIFGSTLTIAFTTTGTVYAAWFGVTNDGVDSSAAMQKCYDSAPAAGAAWSKESSFEVVLVGGNIALKDVEPKAGTWTHGVGYSTKVKGDTPTNGTFALDAITGPLTRFSDMVISASTSGAGIYLTGCNGIQIDHIWFLGILGVDIQASSDSVVEQCWFEGLNGITVGTASGSPYRIRILNNLGHENTNFIQLNNTVNCVVAGNHYGAHNATTTINPPIDINGDYGSLISHNTLVPCHGQAEASSWSAIRMGSSSASSKTQIVNNVIPKSQSQYLGADNNWRRGIFITDLTDGTISGNKIDLAQIPIQVSGTGSGIISGNQISDAEEYAIYVTSGNQSIVGNEIDGNNTDNAAEWVGGTMIHLGSDDNYVQGNRLTGSANTINLIGVQTTYTGNRIGANDYRGTYTKAIALQSQNNNNPVTDDTVSETATGAYTLMVYGVSYLDSNGGAVTATLPDGHFVGQRKVIGMSDASNPSTVSVTHHETSDPEVFTFSAITNYLVLEWTGADWVTVKNFGATT